MNIDESISRKIIFQHDIYIYIKKKTKKKRIEILIFGPEFWPTIMGLKFKPNNLYALN